MEAYFARVEAEVSPSHLDTHQIPRSSQLFRKGSSPSARSAPAANAAVGVKSVRLTTIKCVNKTGELGKDDIFVNYLVATGTTPGFDVNTSIYQFKSGDEQFVKAADAQVFPQAGTSQTSV